MTKGQSTLNIAQKELQLSTAMDPQCTLASFEIDSHVKGYHAYQNEWVPVVNEKLRTRTEPENVVDKYAVCVLSGEDVVGHLKKGKSGRFAKTVFYFLRGDKDGSCSVIMRGKPVNLGDGEGMQVPCTLHFTGQKTFIEVLRKQLSSLDEC